MSRRADRSDPIPDDDPVRWFARLERAIREGDYPLAAIARDRLRRLGWQVASPTQGRSVSRYLRENEP
jgi:hypothetical protein